MRPPLSASARKQTQVLCVALWVAIAASIGAPALADERAAEETEVEVVDMRPGGPAKFGVRNVFAPVTGFFFGGPGYWYDERELRIDTTPSGGIVDLFYIRSNFQKGYEQAITPVIVLLPPRIRATDRDALKVRAFAEGYRQVTVTLPSDSRRDELVIDLEPLPNSLVAVAHRYFAGRGSITFLTSERLAPRMQEAPDGFSVILAETGLTPEAELALENISSPQLAQVFGQQLGEDLVVRLTLTEPARAATELRSRQAFDAARELHMFAVDVVAKDGGAAAVQAAIDALAKLRRGDVTGCALRYEEGLREKLDAGALSRALVPRGEFTDKYIRGAMRRFGEISPNGAVKFIDGSIYRPAVPIELDAALSQAGEARGFLALLRGLVRRLEVPQHRTETLRSLIAPELDAPGFAEIAAAAELREQTCIASR